MSSTNLNSIKLMELDFSALLEGFQINNHASPFPDPRLMEARGSLLPGFPSSQAPYHDRPCRVATSQKSRDLWYPLTSFPLPHPDGSKAEFEPSTAGQPGWHQTLSKMKGPSEVHNSESKPWIQRVIRTNMCPGGKHSSMAEQAPACSPRNSSHLLSYHSLS